MVLALWCVATLFTMAWTVAACINFRAKKNAIPYVLSKSKLEATPSKSKTEVSTAKSATPVTTTSTRLSGNSTAILKTPAPSTIQQTFVQSMVQRKTSVPSKTLLEAFKKCEPKAQVASIKDESTIKEELGDIQLIRIKTKRPRSQDMVKYHALEVKSSEEDPTESSRSSDDTLHGVESLKTDLLTSLAPRLSADSLLKTHVKNTHTITEKVK